MEDADDTSNCDDFDDIDLAIELRREFSVIRDELPYLGEHKGELRDTETHELAGKVRVFVVDIDGAAEDGLGASDLLDTRSETWPFAVLLGRYAGDFSRPVLRILDEEYATRQNMLILDRIELMPPFRGQGHGRRCISAILRHLSPGCRIAAIKPYPLQFEGGARESSDWEDGLRLCDLPADQAKSLRRLIAYYEKFGFKRVKGSDLMILDLYREEWRSLDLS